MILAELSDLCCLELQKESLDKEELCVALILQIAIGNTNGLRTLYGRVLRHRNVFLCPIGALALYLFFRFNIQGEEIDLNENILWFDQKLLVEAGSKRIMKGITDQT